MDTFLEILKNLSTILLIVVAFVAVVGAFVIYRLGSFLKAVARAIDRKINGERVAAVEVVTVPDRGHDQATKAAMASEALKRSLAMSRSLTEDAGYNQVLQSFTKLRNKIRAKDSLKELERVKALYASLYNFQKDEDSFIYSCAMLSKVLMGFCLLLEDGADARLITGMMYFLEDMQHNARRISVIEDSAKDCPALSDELSGLVANLDKLNWLFATYPEQGNKYRRKVEGFVGIVTEKIDIYINAAGYGVNNNESQGVLDNAHKALADVNGAAENILNEILGRGLMKADVELEVLRKDIRLRGLYDK